MRPAISSEKKTATASRKKYSASTRNAIVDARSGNRGGMLLFTHHGDNERAERQDGCGAGEANDTHDHETVAAGLRIVVIAIEQHLIDRRADLAGRCVDERESQIARAVLDAEEIARDPSLRRQHDDACGMGELPEALVPDVAEARRFGEPIDRRLPTGEEVPASRGAGALVAVEIRRLLRGSKRWLLTWIEADDDHVEIAAGVERQELERARQAVEHLRAQHRAVVVDERKDDRPRAEVLAETHGAALFVGERDVERYFPIEILIEADLA